MFSRLTRFLSFSNVIACVALFVALGGSVYAAGKINGKQVKRSSLPGNRIKPKTIQPNRIKPKTLTGRQVRANSLTGAQINEKTLVGVSAAALADVQYQVTTATLPNDGRPGRATANCPPGTHVIGGGVSVSNDNQVNVNSNGPSPLLTGWTATANSWWGSASTMTVTAICIPVENLRGGADSVRYEPAG
ncbi:MAG TPA: hypothetical protein VFY69_06665 [Solirubrobacterales bacterium]|nr:hypothetical protein [Solirubrobacterales bacterium]